MFKVIIFSVLLATVASTDVKKCESGSLPLQVRIKGCDQLPCKVLKGSNAEMEIDFKTEDSANSLQAKVRATVLGLTIPYPLPEDISNVCKNLINEQECPLDSGEDATYKFLFPIGQSYPEIGVTVEVSLQNQDSNVVSCFKVDIQVKKSF